MGRWSQYDTDEERLPSGMTRIGYDADDQTYTFRDADGSIWESAPGSQYGGLHRVSGPPAPRQQQQSTHYEAGDGENDNDGLLEQPPPPYTEDPEDPTTKASWRAEMMPLFNFFMIVGLFLIGVFFYLRATARQMDDRLRQGQCGTDGVPYTIHHGDTCWDIANARDSSVETLLGLNTNLDCDRLQVGKSICVPEA
ncbi:hypothetical protein PFICI_00882 [Pestalotiopsis fici W106-1]|uniref:LysM domain-containing protein n=1 Tax=Pestalotiopsis fici (strain W106-1 / CGMCC3.15140) TaxID=1229662 RepID=W3XM35_PESFW|nr:uncharacterized protein PFICI_00882 [Pestalotiopsis fici W106-1]ETS87054.1 hypothetical protein PFICI_00882 [Pestalotiopsis fici W106-1]